MIRTQIQLPDQLYREVQRVAQAQEWSIAEVMRRGAEAVTKAYPAIKQKPTRAWKLPPPIRSNLLGTDPKSLREIAREDMDHF